ncbi:DNA polymerase Y family protein [Psychromicrobium lacuslunae]|uniref:UmuC domain-containing protein n=1 Tax=Psychromicrobium lacuslunae TaxID=1618207 RepID=A0A0D4C1S2_9MICC|nr:DNA polymerase Y family protein [Psychromicrobium lacuslunae]AJT42316.1 hypothetical protein UM93_13940 [Psychromicrobium lacuslunae]
MNHRAIVLWCPDWPVTAVIQEQGLDPEKPLALVDRGEVFACSAAARQHGVKRGLKVREAQARCTTLEVLDYDPAIDSRAFAPILAAIEQIMPGVQVLRPGTCAIRAKGPARYFGGEQQAADVLRESLLGLGIPWVSVGIADGIFAAEQAARKTSTSRIVAPGASPDFLSTLGLDVLAQPELATLLQRLGLQTLGDFAALTDRKVRNRFGEEGARAHLLARGLDPRAVRPRTPPRNMDIALSFEPALERVDQLAFAVKTSAEKFIDGIAETGQVCTELRVQLFSDSGEQLERVWKHPQFFDAEDVLDRVRWQLQGSVGVPTTLDAELSSGIVKVVLSPETTDDRAAHARGLWGNGPQERVHHGLSRIQSMVGHGAVLTAVLTGGRMLAQRRVLIPWGDSPPLVAEQKSRSQPWPGALSGPAPATLFEHPPAVTVLDAAGQPITVNQRLQLSGSPAFFDPPASSGVAKTQQRLINAWAGPWPVDERWWDAADQQIHRFQIVDSADTGWLLFCQAGEWLAEARYD